MSLQMVEIDLVLPHLLQWAHDSNLPADDQGYLVHAALRTCFGSQAPQPFALPRPNRQTFKVLGYGESNADALRQTHQRLATPSLAQAVPVQTVRSKEMPQQWPAGLKLGFETKIRPVVRSSRKGGKGCFEYDAYQMALRNPSGAMVPNRDQIYLHWLNKQMTRYDAACLVEGRVKSYRLSKPRRRNGRGRPRTTPLPLPEVEVRGVLEVVDSKGFVQLLARGVGRHRAFGFGMLLLRPV